MSDARRVANDEVDLLGMIDDALGHAKQVTWAIDLADGPAALAITLLLLAGQRVLFLPGVAVNRAAAAYRGEGKTDAKDAAIIADQARMRRDLRELKLGNEAIAELRMLTAHRADIAADRTRAINRLRIQLLGTFPALERVVDFTNRGPLVLISGFQTPDALAAVAFPSSRDGSATARSATPASSRPSPGPPLPRNRSGCRARPWPPTSSPGSLPRSCGSTTSSRRSTR